MFSLRSFCNFYINVLAVSTWSWRLPLSDGEEVLILVVTCSLWFHDTRVTDREINGQMDRILLWRPTMANWQ